MSDRVSCHDFLDAIHHALHLSSSGAGKLQRHTEQSIAHWQERAGNGGPDLIESHAAAMKRERKVVQSINRSVGVTETALIGETVDGGALSERCHWLAQPRGEQRHHSKAAGEFLHRYIFQAGVRDRSVAFDASESNYDA